jgi:hypothetical protein
MPYGQHFFKSKHGVFYFRFAVSKALRLQFPQLPAEVRRSLNTKGKKEAIALSRYHWLTTTAILEKLTITMNITEALKALDTQFTNPDFQAEFDSAQLGKLHKQHSKLWQVHNWLAERDSSLVTDNTLE